MSLSLRFAARSHVGLIREGNEDSGYAGPRLLAVADGMGGQAAGEVASSVVIATLAPLDEDVPGSELLDTLASAVEVANDRLREMVEDDPRLEGMGTTLTALLRTGSRLGMVHVGDSRAYLLRDGDFQQLTQDHTWVQRLVEEGRITEEEAGHHPQRSLLMRAIDGRGNVELDLSIREARVGDRYLLCSDGLSGVVSAETIADTLAKGEPAHAVEALIQLALRGGGPDNVTCIVADVLEGDDRPVEIPTVTGAAAEHQYVVEDTTPTTPAARAAELARGEGPDGDEDDEDEDQAPRGRRRWMRRLALPVALLVVVAGGAYAWYAWSQTQYYVGPSGDHVAIYRGLNQELVGLKMSKVYADKPDIALTDLPEVERDQVRSTISTDNLAAADKLISNLKQNADLCHTLNAQLATRPAPVTPAPQASTPPRAGATSGAAGRAAAPTPSAVASPQPNTGASPTPSLSTDDVNRLIAICGRGESPSSGQGQG
jgi:serine/threonine protein phosphatase PrpC